MLSHVIEAFGWRFGFRFSGLASLVVLIPVILLLVRDTPRQMGLEPYRVKDDGQESKAATEPIGLTLAEARKTPIFWLLVVALLGLSISVGAPNAHTVPFLGDLGYTAAFASAVISLTMVFLTLGKVIMGYVLNFSGKKIFRRF